MSPELLLPPIDTVGAIDTSVNILIVDDEPKNLTVLETVLDDPAYRLVRAGSGPEALLALMSAEFAVLVLDVQMPGMSGFELAQMVKQRKKTAGIPIVFLTAYYNEDQHVLEGYGSGAVDYLHKPVNPAVLRSKVAVFAELHRKSRALEFANQSLKLEVAERTRAEVRLSELNESLEQRVIERTEALRASESQLRDADRRKDEFLATLAHELRNPLAPMRNAAQVMRLKGGASPELQWAPDMIDRQVQAMSRLIEDLMDVSRITRGKLDLRLDELELSQVLREAVDTVEPLVSEFRHELELALPDQAIWIKGDPVRLAQVFTNLLNNAAKYMDEAGRITVTVSIEDEHVVVVVKDDGIGIAADRLEAVFAMFSQVDTALSRSRGGLGIGLTLTRHLTEMHGGRVLARSKGLGHGSEFEVRLPLPRRTGQSEPVAGTARPRFGVLGRKSPLRILIADDNQDAASSLADLLEIMGHQVLTVHDGQAAVDAAADFDPALLLLDIGMPKLNGYEACEAIRRQPGGSARAIYAITGWGQPSDKLASHGAGFDLHLVKPVDLGRLEELIEQLIVTTASRPE